MGGGKNVYVLTGHGYWNRKHYPFMCMCKRGESSSPNHICRGYSNKNYKELIKKSRERWEARKDTTIKRGKKYIIC